MTRSVSSGESLVRGNSGRQLALITTGTLTFTTGRFALSPLLPTIMESLEISAFEAGLALTVMFGLTALVRYPGGRLSDDLTRKTVLVGSLIVTVVGFAVLAVVRDYPTFLLGVTAAGVGVGLYSTAAIARLSDIFVDRRGFALGVNNSAVYVAGVLGAGLASLALAVESWRAAFLPVLVVLVVLVPAVHRWNDEPYVIARPQFDLRETVARLAKSSRVRQMLIVGALFGVAWQGVVTFLPTFLQAEKSVPVALSNNLFALLFLVGVGANLLAGRMSDRVDVPYLVAGVAAITTGGLVAVIVAETFAVILVGVVVLGAGLSAVWPALQTYMMQLFPEDSKGGDYGAFSAGYLGISSLGPGVVGFVADQTNYTVAFAGLAACLVLSTVLALGLTRGK